MNFIIELAVGIFGEIMREVIDRATAKRKGEIAGGRAVGDRIRDRVRYVRHKNSGRSSREFPDPVGARPARGKKDPNQG